MGCPVDGGWYGVSDSDVSHIIFTEQKLHYNVVSFKLFRVERKSHLPLCLNFDVHVCVDKKGGLGKWPLVPSTSLPWFLPPLSVTNVSPGLNICAHGTGSCWHVWEGACSVCWRTWKPTETEVCSVSQTFLRKKYVINVLSLETVFVSKILNPVYFVSCLCRKGRVSILPSLHV